MSESRSGAGAGEGSKKYSTGFVGLTYRSSLTPPPGPSVLSDSVYTSLIEESLRKIEKERYTPHGGTLFLGSLSLSKQSSSQLLVPGHL